MGCDLWKIWQQSTMLVQTQMFRSSPISTRCWTSLHDWCLTVRVTKPESYYSGLRSIIVNSRRYHNHQSSLIKYMCNASSSSTTHLNLRELRDLCWDIKCQILPGIYQDFFESVPCRIYTVLHSKGWPTRY